MKTIASRVSKLEDRLAAQRDEQGRSPADVLRERRRRRLIAEGRNPEEESPQEDFVDPDHQSRTIAEILRLRFRGRAVEGEND
jgi:hypothetical protein